MPSPNPFLCIRAALYPKEWIRLVRKARNRRAARKSADRDPEKPEFKDYKFVYCHETGSWKTVLREKGMATSTVKSVKSSASTLSPGLSR